MASTIISTASTEGFDFGGFGVRWKIDGDESAQRFSVVHHPIAARTLAAPLHRSKRLVGQARFQQAFDEMVDRYCVLVG